jgi:hypothetical protein
VVEDFFAVRKGKKERDENSLLLTHFLDTLIMLACRTLRGVLPKPIRTKIGTLSRQKSAVNDPRRIPFKVSRSLAKATARNYCTAQKPIAESSLSSFFVKKEPIKCTIKVTMKLNPSGTPQAVFSAPSGHVMLDSNINSIPVMQRNQPAAAKLLRAIAGLKKRTENVNI